MTVYFYSIGRARFGGWVQKNARFFTAPESDAAAVVIAGNFPKIKSAYERIGVPVTAYRAAGSVPELPADLAERVAPSSTVLTKRELCADLEAMSVEFNPRATKAELAVIRDAARLARGG
jgi:hypothetical protein